MTNANPVGYFNRFSPAKNWEEVLFVSGVYYQSAESNELQTIMNTRLKGVTDAIFKDGDVVRGAAIAVNQDTGHVRIDVGDVYLLGGVRTIAAAELDVANIGVAKVGVMLVPSVVTELEDPTLRNPTVGLRGSNMPGAKRRIYTLYWAKDTQAVPADASFFPVYTIVDGNILDQKAPPSLDAVTEALARYDRDANGSYIVSGNTVTPLGLQSGNQVFSIREGVANVLGYKLTRQVSFRLVVPEQPDLQTITAEPHVFADAGAGTMTIPLNHGPVDSVQKVVITAEKTVAITKGAAGGNDPLPDTSVAQIMSVKVGGTTYTQGTDYTLALDGVNWAPPGAEPASGTSVTVTYRYLKQTTVGTVGRQSVDVSGAVTGSTVLIDYKWKLARIDAMCMDRYGNVTLYKGVSSSYLPQIPRVPETLLVLAVVTNNWGLTPIADQIGVRAIPMSTIKEMQDQIADLFDLAAQEALLRDISAKDPVSKRGVVVDPFTNDDLRDPGVPQTASIFRGELSIAIDATIADISPGGAGNQGWQLSYTVEPIISQLYETGSSKINPYQAFDPIPASLALDPNVDAWTEYQTQYLSAQTNQIWIWLGGNTFGAPLNFAQFGFVQSAVQSVSAIDNDTQDVIIGNTSQIIGTNMRSRSVNFTLSGFEPNEQLSSLTFDGITVTALAP